MHDPFHGWPGIHSKTAQGPNIWSSETKFMKPHQFKLLILPYDIGHFASTRQNKKFKICSVTKRGEGKSPQGMKIWDRVGWRREGRVPVVYCKTKQPPLQSIHPQGGLVVGRWAAHPSPPRAPESLLSMARCTRVCAETTWNTARRN